MAEYVPVHALQGGGFTSQASATVVGGTLLAVSGSGTVAHAGLTSLLVVGIAAHDAASGAKVTVLPIRMVHQTVCGTAGVTAGNPLKSDANGLVMLWVAGTDSSAAMIGKALTTASAAAPVRWIGTA
jgi:hypothetical protein